VGKTLHPDLCIFLKLLEGKMSLERSRLLILACSRRKSLDSGVKPAIERYDGFAFRLLRRFLKTSPTDQPDLLIISAEYGLIKATTLIPYYDRQMTKTRSIELNDSCISGLADVLRVKTYHELCTCAGQMYFQALSGLSRIVPHNTRVLSIQGSMGQQSAALYDWLYQESPKLPYKVLSTTPQKSSRFRGVEINLTNEQVLDLARKQIETNDVKGVDHYYSWYVLVDEQPVALKWLVSKITGLAVGSFTSGEARRFLTQLGVEVKRL
jgi:hypothetical protein